MAKPKKGRRKLKRVSIIAVQPKVAPVESPVKAAAPEHDAEQHEYPEEGIVSYYSCTAVLP
jgi:hypothetical protein